MHTALRLCGFVVFALFCCASAAVADPLPYTVLKKEVTERAATKRNRLSVTIAPTADQSRAAQADLVDTVKAAAQKLQQESGLPVVTVNMICQRAANAYGELQLAIVSYIPDGKGYDGKQTKGPWDNLMAAERGFTAQELEYLRLWAEMRGQFQKGGETDEEALGKAIAKRMKIKPDTVQPHMNFMQAMK